MTAMLWKTTFPIPTTTRSLQAATPSLASSPPFQTRRPSLRQSRRMRRAAQQRFRKRSRRLRLVQNPGGAQGDPRNAHLRLLQASGAEEGHEKHQMRLSTTGIQRILPMTAPPGIPGNVPAPIEKANALPLDPPGWRTGTAVDLWPGPLWERTSRVPKNAPGSTWRGSWSLTRSRSSCCPKGHSNMLWHVFSSKSSVPLSAVEEIDWLNAFLYKEESLIDLLNV